MPIVMGIGAAIGGIASAIGAGGAANAQQKAAQQAQQIIQQNQNQALGIEKGALGTETSNLQPYVNAGQTALSNLSGMQPFSAPTAQQAAETPGYQFQLTQGLKALQNSAAARGGLLSSGTAKAINDYAQGQAASNYGQVYNRALNTYQTNFGNQMGIAGLGANVGTNLSSLQQGNANAQSGILGQSAAEQAQQINNAGAARASGYAAQGNIWGNLAPGLTQSAYSGITGLRNYGGPPPGWGGGSTDTVPVPPGYVPPGSLDGSGSGYAL